MVACCSVAVDCRSSFADLAGSSVLGPRELAAPVVCTWFAAFGFGADSGGSVLVVAWGESLALTGAEAAQSADSHGDVQPLPSSDVPGGVAVFSRGGYGHWQPGPSRLVRDIGGGVAR